MFWSVTVYDTKTPSEIDSGQGHVALRSLFELEDARACQDAESEECKAGYEAGHEGHLRHA